MMRKADIGGDEKKRKLRIIINMVKCNKKKIPFFFVSPSNADEQQPNTNRMLFRVQKKEENLSFSFQGLQL